MFWNHFTQLCAAKGLSPNGVAKELSISSGSVTKWKTGTIPQNGTLKKIADYFGVSVSYLKGETEEQKKPAENGELTEHEQNVINAYRLQPHLQEAVDRVLGVEKEGKILLFTAAQSADNRPTAYVYKDKESWKKIQDAPDTDDTLI